MMVRHDFTVDAEQSLSCGRSKVARWVHALALLGCSMMVSPAMADPVADAAALLDQIEAHCIQPEADRANLLTPPDGWSPIPQDRIAASFEIAMTETDVLIATGYFDWRAETDDVDGQIAEGGESSRSYAREDLDEGTAVLIENVDQGLQLFLRTDNYGTVHAECTLWAMSPDHPINDLIIDRWALPVPNLWVTPYGSRRDVQLGILANGKIAELYATITQATAAAGPVPLLLTFGTAPL